MECFGRQIERVITFIYQGIIRAVQETSIKGQKGREGKREGQKREGGDGELFFLKLLLTNLLIFDPMIILQRINF